MIPREEISRLSARFRINETVLEKDYVLTWILLGIEDSDLYSSLAFKGGTALKTIYFPQYRYSEDLDFTLLKEIDTEKLLEDFTTLLSGISESQGIQLSLLPEKMEVRDNSITLYVVFVGPLQARMGKRSIKVDFTKSEKIIYKVEPRKVRSHYSDAIEKKVLVYSLEEILTEKLCAIIGRTEPRDLYDIWYLFEKDLDFSSIPFAFKDKAEFKDIDPGSINRILKKKKNIIARMWQTRLAGQVRDLPELDGILRKVNRNIRKYITGNI